MNNDLKKYFDSGLILGRFTTFEDLKNMLNEVLEDYDLKVKDYDFKSDYDNDFEDYLVMLTIGNGKEDLYDIDLWYAVTRTGERIIVESAVNEV